MKRILIVEDDVVTTQVYANLLESEGYAVNTAPDGETAYGILAEVCPDIVLLDLLLPKVHGLQVLKKIRAIPHLKDVPVIVLSNAYLSTMVKAAWKEGANMCLTKADCTPDYLLAVVRTTLNASTFTPTRPPSAPEEPTPEFQIEPEAVAPEPEPAPEPATPAPEDGTASQEPEVRSFFTSVGNESVQSLQSQIRSRFVSGTSMILESLRSPQAVFQARHPDTEWMVPIFELYEAVHPLSGTAAVAGFSRIAHLASALEALLKELMEDPNNLNSSSIQTVTEALELFIHFIQVASEAPPEPGRQYLILVVDDDPISLQMIRSALEGTHLRAILLQDPTVAARVLENNYFDLIFADVNMPELDGFQFCEKVRKHPQNALTPVVMVTSLNTFEVRTRSANIGANDMIAKPFVPSELALKALTYLYRAGLGPIN